MNGAITKIRAELLNTFNQVFDVFLTREDVLYYKPTDEGWSMHEVLEHIFLANYFLLRIVSKQTERALHAISSPPVNQKEYALDKSLLARMESTGSPMWVPQRFIEPSGEMPLLQLKMGLYDQLDEGMQVLQNAEAMQAIINGGEQGKTDALHYLYFLVQHMQRHLGQIERIQGDFDEWQKGTIYTESIVLARSICLN